MAGKAALFEQVRGFQEREIFLDRSVPLNLVF